MHGKLARLYFRGEIPDGFGSLFLAKTLNNFGSGLLGIFLPIFLYTLFDNDFQLTMYWYLLGSAMYFILIPHGARLLNTIGFVRSLKWSAIIGASYYSIFFFVEPTNVAILIPFSIIALSLWRVSYWLPYHITFIHVSRATDRGKQLSLIYASASLLRIVAPIISGFLITYFSYDSVFAITVVLFLVSIFPYTKIPSSREEFRWSYKETWCRFFAKENRFIVLPMLADGAENALGLTVWPIFMFILLDGNYLEVGILSTLIVGITVVVQLITGKALDRKHAKERILKRGTILYAIGWIVKIFVHTAFHIFLAGVYHTFTKVFTRGPLDALVYEIAADQGHYMDEFTVLRDLAINAGKVLMYIVVIVASFYMPIQWTFVFAAVSTLGVNLLYMGKIRLDAA